MLPLRKFCLALATVAALALITGLALDRAAVWQPAAVTLAVTLALGFGAVPALRGYQYTAWIIVAVVAAMIYPNAFLRWGDFDLRNRWLVLFIVQAVMFGMGTQMSLHDFAGVVRSPWPVLVGVVGQFTIMPLVGLALTKVFSFSGEIAAGVILIGSCSAGLASNVMTYLARGNLPLSVSMTACTTMLAPLVTPFWMTLLAGEKVSVSYIGMMMEIVKIVLVPIGAALLHDFLKRAGARGRGVVHGIAGLGAVWLVTLAAGGWTWMADGANEETRVLLTIPGFMLGAAIVGVVYHRLTLIWPALDRWMPFASMFGIVYFTTVTTAAGREHLLAVGALLFVAAVLHNTAGYFFGYGLSRLCGMDRTSARTVAFEVGLQNGGMASGLAGAMGKLGTVGLAAAIFSPWMNISGSVLANFWSRRPPKPDKTAD